MNKARGIDFMVQLNCILNAPQKPQSAVNMSMLAQL
jgi:hypothetical protein